MLPAKCNKINISKLTEEEQKLFRLYGKLPIHKNVLTNMQKDQKSGNYMKGTIELHIDNFALLCSSYIFFICDFSLPS
ncbi:hypothetical protein SCLCIDRAFT_24289 [Scleroderma citrinum Foug A]|uniref:mRNA stability protein n=1 Tax=Scleroderma citrinum Foug A TaxID=1036808 RepID=A0A0C3E4L3_9AGAM|nr:hypothetical protein SCLCIDRAFT_24289 [Scleroderma citrinum Foug A]